VKGFVWVDTTATPTHLYYATTSQIHGLVDNGTTVSALSWSPLSGPGPSPIIVVDGVLWVGSGGTTDASLRGIDVSDGTEVSATVLGDPAVAKTAGAPTFDIQTSMITVGTDEGRVYAVEVP
jgi:hypothetical protein